MPCCCAVQQGGTRQQGAIHKPSPRRLLRRALAPPHRLAMVELDRALAAQLAAASDAAESAAREEGGGAAVSARQQLLEAEGMALYQLAQVGAMGARTRAAARPMHPLRARSAAGLLVAACCELRCQSIGTNFTSLCALLMGPTRIQMTVPTILLHRTAPPPGPQGGGARLPAGHQPPL